MRVSQAADIQGTPGAGSAGRDAAATLAALRRGELAGVRELHLPGLGLREFPREVFGLAASLEVLDVSGNALTDLPEDIGRLGRLGVLFASGNPMPRLPVGLGGCAALGQLGFRGCGMRDVPGEALPPQLRWLTLTDNRIETLPAALGERPALQKLMLAGNRLRHLPHSLAGAARLELLRLSANAFDTLPPWLASLPRLAWLAWAGNPLDPAVTDQTSAIPWAELQPGRWLGEGASGEVREVLWTAPGTARPLAAALKLFKGRMTSDGLPEREMAACLRAGPYPQLTGALGRVVGHPEGRDGLLMPLLPAQWRVLAGPPSLQSCSRDVYPPAMRLAPAVALRIAHDAAAAAAHLHARGVLHGDLYGHNLLWDGTTGAAVLSDFGAASFLPDGAAGEALRRLETRAWGLLLGELVACSGLDDVALRRLEQDCVQPAVAARPTMTEALAALAAHPLLRH
ncbi:leucine-rich repeat domain-containing protein [Roseomonas haemaphysalidis]|uniref:leucine-rich repeat domain-containing protein n=1 Tax=Roseomonas haemaphysalidis TaxID=2768162 RepID=UPI001A973340